MNVGMSEWAKYACVSFHDYDLFLTNGPTELSWIWIKMLETTIVHDVFFFFLFIRVETRRWASDIMLRRDEDVANGRCRSTETAQLICQLGMAVCSGSISPYLFGDAWEYVDEEDLNARVFHAGASS